MELTFESGGEDENLLVPILESDDDNQLFDNDFIPSSVFDEPKLMSDEHDDTLIKEVFLQQLMSLRKSENCSNLSYKRYQQIVEQVCLAKAQSRKTSLDYRRVKRYDVILDANKIKRLVVPDSLANNKVVYYAYNEQMFDIIHDCHMRCNHGGRNRIEEMVKLKYKNITREAIMVYLKLCPLCCKKKKMISYPDKGMYMFN